jgi:cyclase
MARIITTALAIFFFSNLLFSQEYESKHFIIQELDEGVYAMINKTGGYAICNSGIIDLGDETLVFDSFISPEAAKDLKKAAEELTGHKVKYLINSHFHNDHIRGNQVFNDAEIISTERTKELIEEYEPEELKWEAGVVDQRIESTLKSISEETDTNKLEEDKMWLGYYKAIKESMGEYKITLPNVFLKDTIIIKGSKRSVLLFTEGKGPTESDIVMWLPEEKILFAGDILFLERHPWLGDGFVEGWVDYIDDLIKLNAKFVVPGHGPVSKNLQFDQLIKYIQTISALVDDAIKNNFTDEEIKAIAIPDEYKSWWFGLFFTPNLVIQYEKKTQASDQ